MLTEKQSDGYFIPSDMSEESHKGIKIIRSYTYLEEENNKSFVSPDSEQIIKSAIKFVALRLIRDTYGFRERMGIDIIRDEILPTQRKHFLPYFFYSAKMLVRKEQPLPYIDWALKEHWRRAKGDIDAHTSRRWKAQMEAVYRYIHLFPGN